MSDEVLRIAGGRRVGYLLFGADTRPALLYMHPAWSLSGPPTYAPGLVIEWAADA